MEYHKDSISFHSNRRYTSRTFTQQRASPTVGFTCALTARSPNAQVCFDNGVLHLVQLLPLPFWSR